MSIKLIDFEIFIAIVDAGSLSRAAENLAVPKSRISRHLKELEDGLDTRLLERTTRSISLTESGETVYRSAHRILGNVAALQARVASDTALISGRLSVFAPAEFISRVLGPRLPEFTRRYPALELEFLSGAARPDLLHDRLDLIIHPDIPEDSSFVAAKVCRARTDFYASPAYIAENGEPQHPSELYHHSCIAELDQNRRDRPWLFQGDVEFTEPRMKPRFRCDAVATVHSLTEQGLGIAMLPVFLCEQAVRRNSLVGLFGGKHLIAHDIYGIYSSRRLKPRKLEVFLDFLKEALPAEI